MQKLLVLKPWKAFLNFLCKEQMLNRNINKIVVTYFYNIINIIILFYMYFSLFTQLTFSI